MSCLSYWLVLRSGAQHCSKCKKHDDEQTRRKSNSASCSNKNVWPSWVGSEMTASDSCFWARLRLPKFSSGGHQFRFRLPDRRYHWKLLDSGSASQLVKSKQIASALLSDSSNRRGLQSNSGFQSNPLAYCNLSKKHAVQSFLGHKMGQHPAVGFQ